MLKFYAALFMAVLPLAHADLSVRIDGTIHEKGTRTPLDGVNVYLLPQANPQAPLKATTNASGDFQIENVPEGSFTWVVNVAGYLRLEQQDSQLSGASNDKRTLYLEKDSYQVYETTIYDADQKRDSSMRTIPRQEFMTAPGTAGDPLRAVQDLPGMNRPASFSSEVLIQGSGPLDVQYLLNGVNVPLVFHFGGITSAIVPEAIDRVDIYQAGYGPEWGRATGGLVGVWTRSPRKDRWHGLLGVDTFNAEALIEGNAGDKTGFLLSARQSYVGQVLKFVVANHSGFDLTVVPTYGDSTGLFESQLTERDKLQITAFGSQDSLEFLLGQPLKTDPSIRGTFDEATGFYRFIPQLVHHHSNSTISRYTLGIGRDYVRIDTSSEYFRMNDTQLNARAELERQMTDNWKTFLGIDNQYDWANLDVNLGYFFTGGGVLNPLSVGTVRTTTVPAHYQFDSLYSRNEVLVPGTALTILPNVRLDYFSQTNEWLPQPRPALRYALNESTTLRASGGLYYQAPQPQETDATFGNPYLKAERAWHADIGADKDFREGTGHGWVLNGDAFYKRMDRVVIPSQGLVYRNGSYVSENFNNNGKGNAVGIQAQLKYNLHPWSFSTIYTLSRTRSYQPDQGTFPSQYDETHLVGLLGSVQLPRNWSISTRFRYSTGVPVTPVLGGYYDADNDVYIPIRGNYFSDRLPAFMELDLRFDKKWAFDTWILSLYLDILNVTNRQNQELLIYSYNYSQTASVQGLPILPTFGLKGEF